MRLVEAAVSADTVAALRHLLYEAEHGHVVGIACVVVHPASHFSIDIAGEAKRVPLYARGMAAVLDDQLALLVVGPPR